MTVLDPVSIWQNRHRIRFRSAPDGEVLHGLPEVVFRLPDCASHVAEGERTARILLADDFCILDGRRHFVRVTLPAPVIGYANDVFTWGVWAEVASTSFNLYWDQFGEDDNSSLAPFKGRLANAISGYPRSLGLSGRIEPSSSGERPRMTLLARKHPLARAQRDGITPQTAVAHAQSVGVLLMVA